MSKAYRVNGKGSTNDTLSVQISEDDRTTLDEEYGLKGENAVEVYNEDEYFELSITSSSPTVRFTPNDELVKDPEFAEQYLEEDHEELSQILGNELYDFLESTEPSNHKTFI